MAVSTVCRSSFIRGTLLELGPRPPATSSARLLLVKDAPSYAAQRRFWAPRWPAPVGRATRRAARGIIVDRVRTSWHLCVAGSRLPRAWAGDAPERAACPKPHYLGPKLGSFTLVTSRGQTPWLFDSGYYPPCGCCHVGRFGHLGSPAPLGTLHRRRITYPCPTSKRRRYAHPPSRPCSLVTDPKPKAAGRKTCENATDSADATDRSLTIRQGTYSPSCCRCAVWLCRLGCAADAIRFRNASSV